MEKQQLLADALSREFIALKACCKLVSGEFRRKMSLTGKNGSRQKPQHSLHILPMRHIRLPGQPQLLWTWTKMRSFLGIN